MQGQRMMGATAPVREVRALLPWWAVGVVLAVLELVVFVTQDRGIGASTAYAHIVGVAWPALRNASWHGIANAATWEEWFLLGGCLGAWLMTRARVRTGEGPRGEPPTAGRVAASFAGGFLVIFGARLASGCTSGHILTGGIQLAVSSLWFAFCTITAGVLAIRLLRRSGVS